MRWPVCALLLLASCGQSPSEKAQSDVDFLEAHHASNAEKCTAYTKLADAYLAEHNAEKWQTARLMQRSTCLLADTAE